MRVDVVSDLHLEFADLTLPGGDILIVSGDAYEAKHVRQDGYNPDMVMLPTENPQKRPDRYMRFLIEECSAKYRTTIMVMGNHEHYGYQFEKTYNHLKSQLPEYVHILEKETVETDGVLFVAATLWTDCNSGDSLTMYHLKSNMNDYHQIKMHSNGIYHRLTPERTYYEHMRTKEYIEQVLRNNRERVNPLPVVMVTHHAPSKLSIKPQYEHDHLMNGGYSSDLSELMLDHPEILAWHHGHTHDEFKYQIGNTWVLCNPRGYYGYESRANKYAPKGYEIINGKINFKENEWNND